MGLYRGYIGIMGYRVLGFRGLGVWGSGVWGVFILQKLGPHSSDVGRLGPRVGVLGRRFRV